MSRCGRPPPPPGRQAALWPGVTVAGARHLPALEAPAEVIALTARFWAASSSDHLARTLIDAGARTSRRSETCSYYASGAKRCGGKPPPERWVAAPFRAADGARTVIP